jgi:hypothetical protein
MTQVTQEVREIILSTISHENYRVLAEKLMDGVDRETIKASIGFDDTQIDTMQNHIVKIAGEQTLPVVAPEVVPAPAGEVATGVKTGVGQIIQANVPVEEVKEVVGSTGNDVPMTQPEAGQVNPNPAQPTTTAPEASQPANDANTANVANTEELTA